MPEETKKRNIKTPRAVGAYVTLVKPKAMEAGKEPKYSIMLLWDKTADLTEVKQAILDAAKEEFKPKQVDGKEVSVLDQLKLGMLKGWPRSGDSKDNAEERGFAGKVFLNASSTQRVQVIDVEKNIIDPSEVYSGCEFHASLRFYAYDQKGNKGVGCGLQSLLLVHKGKRMDGRGSAEDDFKDFKPDVREDESIKDML